ncbi:hypothetical protein MJO29_008490 [Puccinia striiformis f. sp. tritici]|nr:hypothetical protein MJO29_008490 [Puccinia striiformis f. sp. tritici]
MVMSMNDLIQGDGNDLANQYEGVRDSLAPVDTTMNSGEDNLGEIDPNTFFGDPSTKDTEMDNSLVVPASDPYTDQLCTDLQSKFKLDPAHLSIAMTASKCAPEARHANFVFAMAAVHQIGVSTNVTATANHSFNERFKDFVQCQARIILLNPSLEAYSNNPHRNGALPRTLYYLTLDAVEQQPIEWKEDNLAPGQLNDDPVALDNYREVVGDLLKHQRSNLRTLLLANILSTQRITVKGAVPNRHEMITAVSFSSKLVHFHELILCLFSIPPDLRRPATKRQQVDRPRDSNPSRSQLGYARLVMVHYYVHKSKKTSQWLEIDERLGILRASSADFQRHHAQLVLDKDNELFSHLKKFCDIPKEDFTVPSLEDVRASISRETPSNH